MLLSSEDAYLTLVAAAWWAQVLVFASSIYFLLLACKTNPRFFSLGRFENVMALTAPAWSPASVQFTHGFPWRLIQAEHGGFLPGNIILTAKASNLAIRRMSVLDVASWPTVHRWSGSQLRPSAQPPVSSTWIFIFCDINGHANYLDGFLFPSYAAVCYHSSDSYLPDYLVRGTLEFGLNFLTF